MLNFCSSYERNGETSFLLLSKGTTPQCSHFNSEIKTFRPFIPRLPMSLPVLKTAYCFKLFIQCPSVLNGTIGVISHTLYQKCGIVGAVTEVYKPSPNKLTL